MDSSAEKRFNRLINGGLQQTLRGGTIGLEKESLRVARDGSLALTPHPRVFGSPLTHSWITTDFSEALIEFVTPPLTDMDAMLGYLCDLQRYVYGHLGDEYLWATSMPCILRGETHIPIAEYGPSHRGRMKHIYRVGLGHRYGRAMQVIAGVHFNYSFAPELWEALREVDGTREQPQALRNRRYFAMIRNLQRFGWLIPYLFGASPAVCRSFFGEQETDLDAFDTTTYYYPYATSLRMGDIGYQNNAEYETGFKASYDSLESYVESLLYAIDTPCTRYQEIGVVRGGEYLQLNGNMLQIENEYYSTVRPKQPPRDNEKPSLALRARGVQYVELRSLDVNAFDPLGINETQLRFLEAFMALCLFADSPLIEEKEKQAIDRNEILAAHQGRDPALLLHRNGKRVALREWGLELCTAMEGFCEILDTGQPGAPYSEALERQRLALRDPDTTPSARMLREMRETGEGFHAFAQRMSKRHARYYRAGRVAEEQEQRFSVESARSLDRQRAIEAEDTGRFEDFLQDYFAQR